MTGALDIVPLTVAPPGAAVSLDLAVAGLDWLAVLVSSGVVAGVASVSARPDSGGSFSIGGLSMAPSTVGVWCFGGGAGGTNGNVIAAVPFVPNVVSIALQGVTGSQWAYAVLGGFLS